MDNDFGAMQRMGGTAVRLGVNNVFDVEPPFALGGDADGIDCPCAKHKDCHAAQEASDKNFGYRDIDHLELLSSQHFDLVEVG